MDYRPGQISPVTLRDPHYQNMGDTYVRALEELVTPHPAVQIPEWKHWTEFTGGLRKREFSILCGSTGCLAGDTRIRLNRGGKGFDLPIQDVYAQWTGIAANNQWDLSAPTFVRSYDGHSIRLHRVKNVMLSGVKETVRVRTEQGHSIRLTPCHRVLTERGWVHAGQLKPTDRIAFDTMRPRKRGGQKVRLRDNYFHGVPHHPYGTKCGDARRIVEHRAILEAHMNGMDLGRFINIVRHIPEQAKELKFINPRESHVHHKNHDHYDNRIENLELLPVSAHREHHGDEAHFGAGQVQWAPVSSVDRPGVEATYDIECEDPHHNFVANGLVVHNSGKTTFLANLSAQLLKQAEPHFVMSVETGETDFMKRILSVLERRDLNTGRPITTDDVTGIHTRHAKLLESGVIEFSLYDNRVKVEQLCHDIRWMVDRHGVKVVMMDNLNFFLEVTSAANSIVEMDRVIHELIVLAKQVDTHLIMVMHPKKTDGGRVESEFDIKGSSTAVQEAHNVFLFNRSPKEAIDSGQSSKYTRELKIAKMRRRGHFVGNAILFESIGTRYEERGYL